MRLRVEYIEHLAKRIVTILTEEGFITYPNSQDVTEEIRETIIDDLAIEDEIDEEVLDILEEQLSKLPVKERDNIDFDRMFNMIKRQIAKERDLIL